MSKKQKQFDFSGIEKPIEEDLQQHKKAIEASEGPLSQQQLDELNRAVELEREFGESPIEAGALGAARGLTFGISDQALVKSGIYSQEELREIKKRNETSSLVGDVGATAAALLLSGGSFGAAKGAAVAGKGVTSVARAAKGAEKIAEKAFAKMLQKEGKKSIAKEIVRKNAPKVLGSAVEGSAYGVGKLISEDALGNAELNGENLIASAGTGALLGAVAGGIFEAPKALAPLTKKGMDVVKKGTSRLRNRTTDVENATLDLYGVTASERAKLSESIKSELPEWTVNKAKLGRFKGSESLQRDILTIKDEAGQRVGNAVKKIDEAIAAYPEKAILTNLERSQAYARIAKSLDEEFIQPLQKTPGYKSQLRPVKQLRDEYLDLSKKTIAGNEKITATKLHELRMKTDKLIKFDKNPGQYTLKEDALFKIRNQLNDEIKTMAETVQKFDTGNQFKTVLDDLLEANKDFSYASKLLPYINKKVNKEAAKRNIFNLSDLVLGGASYEVMGGLGSAAVLGKKVLESDFIRRTQILSAVERSNRKTTNSIQSKLDNFIKKSSLKPSTAAKTTATRALIESNLSYDSNGKKPSTKQKAFSNIQENLTKLSSNPEMLERTVSRRTIHLQNIMPNITSSAVQTATRGMQFLLSKLPKSATQDTIGTMFAKRKFEPSDFQLAKFEKYLNAVENPRSILDDLESGTLTREAAEAVKAVYPNLFQTIQTQVVEKLQDSEKAIPYAKRVQLGILLDLPSDSSLLPKNIALLQSNLQPEPTQVPGGPTAARADKLNISERRETKANRISQK